MSSTRAASNAFLAGTNSFVMPNSLAFKAIGKTPFTAHRSPLKDSSPTKAAFSRLASSCPDEISNATKIGKS